MPAFARLMKVLFRLNRQIESVLPVVEQTNLPLRLEIHGYPHFCVPGLKKARTGRNAAVPQGRLEDPEPQRAGNVRVSPLQQVESRRGYRGHQAHKSPGLDPQAMTHYSFRIGRPHFARLMAHLFPGDGEHHGASSSPAWPGRPAACGSSLAMCFSPGTA